MLSLAQWRGCSNVEGRKLDVTRTLERGAKHTSNGVFRNAGIFRALRKRRKRIFKHQWLGDFKVRAGIGTAVKMRQGFTSVRSADVDHNMTRTGVYPRSIKQARKSASCLASCTSHQALKLQTVQAMYVWPRARVRTNKRPTALSFVSLSQPGDLAQPVVVTPGNRITELQCGAVSQP
jgi:hypothetical protein